ncbi:MAG TPA: DUF924 family protein [Caulobacteraceae bacterium]|nr:DUF924 family protein [Caulobacteraceae bacterium]
MSADPTTITEFWRQAGPKKWFAVDPAFDAAIRARFETEHHAAARGERAAWMANGEGSLALILLLDQFPRNLWRGSAHAFATDPLARRVADSVIAAGADQAIEPAMRPFVYLPFEHSEGIGDQDRSVGLCEALERDIGDASTLKWARSHRQIILRFGRFPHRNACLGRTSTPEEQAFLDGGGFSGGQASEPWRISRLSPGS